MNQLRGSILAFLIALGYQHNSIWKKSIHALFCITLFSTCHKLIWVEEIYPSLYVTFTYIFLMMAWTFYTRYPLYCTYAKILGGIGYSKVSAIAHIRETFTLKPYTSKWREEFLAEFERTRPILMSRWKGILHEELTPNGFVHIGSTAIRNIALAKPQHDCALALTCHTLPKRFISDLTNLGYTYIGVAPHSLDCADHFFYYSPQPEDQLRYGQGFFLHVVTPKVHDWLRTSVAFCEYLSHDTAARESYSNLKKNIISQETRISSYTMRKYELVMKLRAEAKTWMENKKRSQ